MVLERVDFMPNTNPRSISISSAEYRRHLGSIIASIVVFAHTPCSCNVERNEGRGGQTQIVSAVGSTVRNLQIYAFILNIIGTYSHDSSREYKQLSMPRKYYRNREQCPGVSKRNTCFSACCHSRKQWEILYEGSPRKLRKVYSWQNHTLR